MDHERDGNRIEAVHPGWKDVRWLCSCGVEYTETPWERPFNYYDELYLQDRFFAHVAAAERRGG